MAGNDDTKNTLTPVDIHISDTTASGVATPLGQEPPTRAFVEGIPVLLDDPREDPGREAQVAPGQRHHTAADKTTLSPPSRFSLRMSAGWWRSLQYIGMSLHFMASPRPPSPSFARTIPSTLSKTKGSIELQFYTPAGYGDTELKESGTTYPVVVNFHGGGFVLGAASDDARFGRQVMETAGAIFVSVDYRLAPEYPFPAAVEDGADALLYLIRNAAELRIDPMRMATSGFSAGGNICLTSMLRLGDYKQQEQQGRQEDASALLPEHRVVATVAWYPIVDYNRSRAERRATCRRPDQALPSNLTDLFDASYLYPVDIDLLDPYVSPFQASDEQIVRNLPQSILIYTCEWDMLQKEGKEFAHRLGEAPISKDVYHKMIRGVPHGWDKSPNPLRPAHQSEKLYTQCCQKLRAIFSNS